MKFRGRSGNTIVFGDLTHEGSVAFIGGAQVVASTIGVSTGMLDVHGKEIYTGDTVKNRQIEGIVKLGKFSAGAEPCIGFYIKVTKRFTVDKRDKTSLASMEGLVVIR